MDKTPELYGNKLEDPEFMNKLVNTLAIKVEEFLEDPRWLEWSADTEWHKGSPKRADYADTKTIIDRIRNRQRIDDLVVPADVSIIIQNTSYFDFGLSHKETYRVLYMYFSEYEHNL